MGEDAPAGRRGVDWATWVFGIGNFLIVSLLGAFFTWRTNELESRLSVVQTAGEYIAIVADEGAPDYAKSLALSAIFDEGLLSRDLVLETAYRIEDDSVERTVVGPLLYQIAATDELLALPFGFVGEILATDPDDGEGVELTVDGWGLDDRGWAGGLQVQVGNRLRCQGPAWEDGRCEIEYGRRDDVGRIFRRYPDAAASGFRLRFRQPEFDGAALLTVRLLDRDGNARNILSRCVSPPAGGGRGDLAESPYLAGKCRE